MYYKDSNIFLIIIPKCGSKSLKYSLTKAGFEDRSIAEFSRCKYVSVIRDPYDKWISGLSTYMTIKVDHNHITEQDAYYSLANINRLLDIMEFDGHTRKQITAIKEAKGKVNLFSINNMNGLLQWLQDNGVSIKEIVRLHSTMDFPDNFHKNFYLRLKEMTDNEHYRNIVYKYYNEDLQLYRKVIDHERNNDANIPYTYK